MAATPTFFALSVRDLAATVAWYRSTFDLPSERPLPIPEEVGAGALLESPTLVIEVLALRQSPARPPAGPDNMPPHGIFKAGFTVSDLEPYLARFRTMGTRIVAGPFDDATIARRMVIVADPEGNLIHLFAPLRP